MHAVLRTASDLFEGFSSLSLPVNDLAHAR
jgi:hypothetical protein